MKNPHSIESIEVIQGQVYTLSTDVLQIWDIQKGTLESTQSRKGIKKIAKPKFILLDDSVEDVDGVIYSLAE